MRRFLLRNLLFPALLGGLLGPLAPACPAQTQEAGGVGPGDLFEDLTSRVVQTFDFDEPETADPVPLYWVRIADKGFPHWNDAAFFPDTPAGDGEDRCIRIPTIGGNAGLRLVAGVVPIIPEIDYHLRIRVRTEGLRRSRARVVAYFADEDGRRIEPSLSASPLLETDGQWRDAEVVLRGLSPGMMWRDADGNRTASPAWLQVELLIEQPATWNTDPDTRPRVLLEDVVGAAAYFDDLTIWRVPRIELSSTAPHNLMVAPDAPTLYLRAQDVAAASLQSTMRIYDFRGDLVDERELSLSNDWQPVLYRPNLPGYGWYRAIANVTESGAAVSRTWLDFAWMPRVAGSVGPLHFRGFSVVGDDLPLEQWPHVPELMAGLGADSISLPMWSNDLTRSRIQAHRTALSPTVNRLNGSARGVRFVVTALPDELSAQEHANSSLVYETFGAGTDEVWRYLEDFLVSFGQVVGQWQFAPTESLGAGRVDQHPQRLEAILRRLFALVPSPQLVVPWTAEQPAAAALIADTAADAISALPAGGRRSLSTPPVRFATILPNEVSPDVIGEYLAPWVDRELACTVVIEPADAELFGLEHQVGDLVRRTVMAWEAGATDVAIRHPWDMQPLQPDRAMPGALYPVWRTLAAHLSGRMEHARLDLGNDVTAVVFRDAQGNGTIAVWHDSPDSEVVRASIFLGNHSISMCDAFGNTEQVPVVGGVHEIRITRQPQFVDNAVINLALLRSGFRVTPRWIEGAAAVHMHEMVLTNPWKTSIAGTLRIIEPADWDIRQRVRQISMGAGEEIRLPLIFTYPAYETGGPKRIVVDLALQNISTNAVRMESIVELGFQKIALMPHYEYVINPEGNEELVVTLEISNNSDAPAWLSAMVLAEGYGRLELDVAQLKPGETTVRVFRLTDPATRLLNTQIRVGLRERGGSGRFNLLVNATR
ncbi:MAG: hypothetical protein IT430_15615 [Phycisphaerales bacterium]|nr:hypothetical protein [Phycisphaerales bacterium]